MLLICAALGSLQLHSEAVPDLHDNSLTYFAENKVVYAGTRDTGKMKDDWHVSNASTQSLRVVHAYPIIARFPRQNDSFQRETHVKSITSES